jgi:hypothetical protein
MRVEKAHKFSPNTNYYPHYTQVIPQTLTVQYVKSRVLLSP